MFNVGDEVICVSNDNVHALTKGATYTISHIVFEEDLDDFFVRLKERPYEYVFHVSRFKLKSFIPTLKKGDRVICVDGFVDAVPVQGSVYTVKCDSFMNSEHSCEYVRVGNHLFGWLVDRFKLYQEPTYNYGYFPEIHGDEEDLEFFMFGIHN